VPRTLVQLIAVCHLQDTFKGAQLFVMKNNWKRNFCLKRNSDSKYNAGYKMSRAVARFISSLLCNWWTVRVLMALFDLELYRVGLHDW
jgi:hypothetical protein